MSGKTIAEKLLIKPGSAFWLADADRKHLIAPLPDGVVTASGPADASVALLFADDAAAIRTTLEAHRETISRPATVWVAYPKANRTDINRDTLWPILGEFGLRPNGQVAIDDVWSALRFRGLKPGEAPFTGGG